MSEPPSTTQTPDEAPPPPPEHHEHPPYQAHHFDTMVQQVSAGKLGMWVFLATEILMFGGLFCAYAVWRANNFDSFDIGYAYLSWELGAFNTVVLLASSFTMAWGVRAIQLNQQNLCFVMMGLTFLGGLIFMGVKYVEYDEKFAASMGPGIYYEAPDKAQAFLDELAEADEVAAANAEDETDAAAAEGNGNDERIGTALPRAGQPAEGVVEPVERRRPRHAELAEQPEGYYWKHTPEELVTARPFFSIYFLMTGLHGLHVIIGMGLIAWVMLRVKQGEFNTEYNAPVDLVGLYWHLVDLVWIFLFPLLYLM